jgi:site-specific DNA-methyltransferase (adenine-specific)
MVLTDPAYESLERHRKKGTTTRLKQSDASSNEWFDTVPNSYLPFFFDECYRVLKRRSHMYVYGDDETTQLMVILAQRSGFYHWKNLTWVKTAANEIDAESSSPSELAARQVYPGTGYHYPNSTERIIFLEKRSKRYIPSDNEFTPKPDPPGKGRNLLGGPSDRVRGQAGDVFFASRPRNGWPTEKPVCIAEVLVMQSTEPGELVIDPFSGSGSTGEAAVNCGRRVLLSDKSERAVLKSTERLSRVSPQLEIE